MRRGKESRDKGAHQPPPENNHNRNPCRLPGPSQGTEPTHIYRQRVGSRKPQKAGRGRDGVSFSLVDDKGGDQGDLTRSHTARVSPSLRGALSIEQVFLGPCVTSQNTYNHEIGS